ncbi:serine/arginine-rich splicing factor 4 [Manduca sexta]|uniref:Uncharacterized protein n=1 Tax=Manduca sexta TaxID=7130 RepID=A0A921YKT5_MANSE|nr:serine/arginine-rich splicing factor 4 [Manduca sexta]KAG6441161.1 hypothetical protein O3G_MSEX001674 [Manduca sexta]
MANYRYPYPYPPGGTLQGEYPDHGDGFGEYYGLGPLNEEREDDRRPGRSKHRERKTRTTKHSRTRSNSATRSKSRSKSHSRSSSRTRSRTRTYSRSRSGSRHRELNFKEPGFLDAFRVLYLTPSKHKKNTPKYLATKKRQDRIQELLKSDGLGSKKWLFYPRLQTRSETKATASRESCDQRVKVDGVFFRKYKKSKAVDSDAPIAKLKRWELLLYEKLGFIQSV